MMSDCDMGRRDSSRYRGTPLSRSCFSMSSHGAKTRSAWTPSIRLTRSYRILNPW